MTAATKTVLGMFSLAINLPGVLAKAISNKVYPPFAKEGQGGLNARTLAVAWIKSPLTPLLQRGGLVGSVLEFT